MNAPFRLPETAGAVSPAPDDCFAFAILKDGVWTHVAFYPTEAAAWARHQIGMHDDALNAAYPFERYDVIPLAPAPQARVPAGDIVIDLDIPDGDYAGAEPFAVFAANAARKHHADNAWDDKRGRN